MNQQAARGAIAQRSSYGFHLPYLPSWMFCGPITKPMSSGLLRLIFTDWSDVIVWECLAPSLMATIPCSAQSAIAQASYAVPYCPCEDHLNHQKNNVNKFILSSRTRHTQVKSILTSTATLPLEFKCDFPSLPPQRACRESQVDRAT